MTSSRFEGPLGVTLSPSFCKLLVGMDEPVAFEDLEAVLPAAKFELLRQCLDGSRSLGERQALVDVYVESSDHATFTTESVDAMAIAQGLPMPSNHPAAAADGGGGAAGQRPVRENSAVVEGGEEQLITVDSIGEYAAVLAEKLLRTNVASQMSLVRRGLQDVRGAYGKLRKLRDWKEVQRTFRGAIEINLLFCFHRESAREH